MAKSPSVEMVSSAAANKPLFIGDLSPVLKAVQKSCFASLCDRPRAVVHSVVIGKIQDQYPDHVNNFDVGFSSLNKCICLLNYS